MKKQRAFTLLELLVVISIIGLLSSIIFVALGGVRDKAKRAKALHFAAQVHHALGAEAVGIWDFGDQANPTKDSSGYNNDGTINGAVYTCASTDKNNTPSGQGCALSFNGVNDYVGVAASSELTNAALHYTVSIWVNPKIDGDYWTGVVGKPGRNYNFWLGNSNDPNGGFIHHRFHTTASTNVGCPDTSAGSIPMDKWSHVVITNDGSKCQTYINGELKTEITFGGSLVADSTPLYIGRNLDGGDGNYYRGIIDDVRIYSKALSSAQIQKLYAEGARERGLLAETNN